MNLEQIRIAETAAKEFLRRVKTAMNASADTSSSCLDCSTPVQNDALRRQSMELTRALAAMRKP